MNITPEELLRLRLYGQHLTSKASPLQAAADLCGFQAQYAANARHSGRIRAKAFSEKGMVKSWTLRGTLHLFPESDLPLYCPVGEDLGNTDYGRWLYGRGFPVPPARIDYFAGVIREGLSGGPLHRDQLKTLCFQAGMTQEEAPRIFDGWGGVVRLLCEAGQICGCAEPKTYRLAPVLPQIDREEAARRLARRYFSHYGPATLQDGAYFFRWPQKRLRQLAEEIGCVRLNCGGQTCFYLGGRPARLPRIPDCLFLAGFDPMLLGYEKTANPILTREDLRRVFNLTGIVFPTVLLGGQIAGRWKERPKALQIALFHPLAPGQEEILRAQAAALWPGRALHISED